MSKIKIFFFFAFFIVLLNFAFFILNSRFAFAQNVSYPISELGSCRDANECRLYCEIPKNTPACWSYDKYVLNKDVLGEATANISYPINELGNCTSANECFIFCNQPQNQNTCYDFAKSKGLIKEKPKLENIIELAKKELGCQNDLECMVFCQQQENMEACRAFAQKYKLVSDPATGERKPPSESILQKAAKEFGCNSQEECQNFCNRQENSKKCFEFARENNLMSPQEAKDMEKRMEQKKNMVDDAKTELGCDSEDSCRKKCFEESNREKCENLGKKSGKPPMPCASEEECKKYCEKNPGECPGFSEKNRKPDRDDKFDDDFDNTKNILKTKPMMLQQINEPDNQKGDFLGPSGCKTEDECKSYCEKHPDKCPGFPKINTDQSQKNRQTTEGNFNPVRPDSNQEPNQEFRPPAPFQNQNPNFQEVGEQNSDRDNPPKPFKEN